MKKTTKKTAPARPVVETPAPPTGPVLTADLLTSLRQAESLDAAVRVLAPTGRAKTDATYALNATCAAPLPARRGACLKVVAAVVRLNRPFKVADVVAALPDVRGAKYWVGRLAKTGHLVVTE